MGGTMETGTTYSAQRPRVLAALLLLATLYVAALGWSWRENVVDDAYIGFVFLRNLLEGHGFVFHPGEAPVEGVSNIGWILILAPAAALFGTVAAAKLLGGLLVLSGLVLAGWVGHALSHRLKALPQADTLLLAPPLLLAASFEFLYFPLAGMETAALACLLLAMAIVSLRAADSPTLAILGALAFTVHPEAILVFPLFLALRRAPLPPRREREARAPALAGEGGQIKAPPPHPPVADATGPSLSRVAGEGFLHLLLYSVLLALITLARWTAFGAWLPNTFAAKPPADIAAAMGVLIELMAGTHSGVGFPVAGLLGLGLMLLGWRQLRHAAPEAAAMLAAISLTGLLFALYARPDWTGSARYFAPYLPATVLLLWTGALDLGGRLWPGRIAPLAAFGGILLAVSALTLGARLGAMEHYPGYVMAGRSLTVPAEAIGRLVPEGETIATRRIGTVAFVTRRPVFDYVYGLTEPEVARAVATRRAAFEQPSDPELAPIWRAHAPRWILEDEAVLAEIARQAGGGLEAFALHGFTYRPIERYPIAPGVDWVLARRIEEDLSRR